MRFMEDEEILGRHSPEIKELFSLAEQAEENIDRSLRINKPGLNGERYLNNKEVCELLHISLRSLQEYRDRGKISYYKLEGKIMYAQSDVYKMLEDNYNKAWEQD